MDVNSLASVRVKGGEGEFSKIAGGVRQVCIMSLWLLSVYMDAVMKEVKIGIGRMGMRFIEEERGWRLLGLLYADNLVLWVESEDNLRTMVRRLVGV